MSIVSKARNLAEFFYPEPSLPADKRLQTILVELASHLKNVNGVEYKVDALPKVAESLLRYQITEIRGPKRHRLLSRYSRSTVLLAGISGDDLYITFTDYALMTILEQQIQKYIRENGIDIQVPDIC